ncbi:hypothetical protein PMAYCL1PPCAC_21845, partial [Pristionchus mayeri]
MEPTVDPIVETAVFVYTVPYMRWMIPFRIVTSLLGVLVIIIMIFHWRSVTQPKFVAHFNLTLLLAIHVGFNFLSCLFVAIDDIYVLYQQLTWRNGEDLVLSGTMFSFVVIAIERFLATIFYESYEQSPRWLGALFAFVEVFIPIVFTGIDSVYYDFAMRFSYCSIVSPSNLDVVVTISHIFLVCEFFALLLFHVSLFVNWRRMQSRTLMNPSGRYQITENFKTIVTITPLIWCHFLFMIGCTSFYSIYFSLNPVMDHRIYPILEEFSNIIYWHGVLLPLIFFLLYRYGKRQELLVLEYNGAGQRTMSFVLEKHEQIIQKGWNTRSSNRTISVSMSTTIDPIVDTATFVYCDPFMRWNIPFRIVTSLLGVVVISMMVFHRRKFVAHFNLTLLLSIHVILNLLSCLFVAIDDIYILYQQLTWRTGEDLVLTGYACYAWRLPPCVTLYGTMFSLIVISFERFLATVFYKSYEQSPKWMGVLLGVTELIIPLLCTGIITYLYDFSARFSYCTIVSQSNFEVVIMISYVFLACEFFALLLFHFSLFVNWRRLKKRATMDPTGRYQITENFRTCHFLIMIGTVGYFFAYSAFNPTFDPR